MVVVDVLGVMAIVKLLEMKYLVVPRAHLTQENVDAIRDFDPVLADVRINSLLSNHIFIRNVK